MSERFKDLLLALVLIVVGVGALIVLAHTKSGGTDSANVVGFATLPRLYAALLVGLGLLLAGTSGVQVIKERRGTVTPTMVSSALSDPIVLMRAIGTVVLLVLYVVGLEALPFFPVTVAFLALMFLIYGRKPLWRVLIVAAVGAAALDVVFVRIIELPLH